MKVEDVVKYHSKVSRSFDENYTLKSNFSERLSIWEDIIKRYSKPKSLALDAGCGSGVLTKILSQHNNYSIGIEPSEEMLVLARSKKNKYNLNNIKFIKSNIEDYVPSPHEKFDMVVCSSVLEYVDDFKKNFSILCNLLNENGVIIFSLPNGVSFYRNLESFLSSVFGYPRYFSLVKNLFAIEKTSSLLSELQFEILEEKYYGQLKLEVLMNRFFVKKKYFYHNYIIIAKKIKLNIKV
jgi:2-polyprenyl-3-methyl-5-hydroxy-6-metoxy-1,4-benzoquinol methylase